MSIYSILAIILGVMAGVINLTLGMLRRGQPLMVAMRLAAAIISFAVPIVVLVAHSQSVALVPKEWHNSAYLAIALAIFVGVTLMVPATVERGNQPPAPATPPSPTRKTGTLSGQPGVRIANENGDEWVK